MKNSYGNFVKFGWCMKNESFLNSRRLLFKRKNTQAYVNAKFYTNRLYTMRCICAINLHVRSFNVIWAMDLRYKSNTSMIHA